MKNKNILEINNLLNTKQINVIDLIKFYNDNLQKMINDNTNAILTNLSDNALNVAKNYSAINNKKSLLSCIVYSAKDNISVKGIKTTGGCKFLANYTSNINATVIDLLNKNEAILNAKTNMDELGLGGTGLYSGFGYVNNNIYKNHITGGSSSGSALAVANNACQFSIATDTGDSIRRPASLLGIVGYKPTYGSISRYGVFPYAPSLDHVGILANHVIDIAIVSTYLFQQDLKDSTSIKNNIDYQNVLKPVVNKIKIGYFNNINELWDSDLEKKEFNNLITLINKLNLIELVPISVDINLINLISAIYQIISYSEGFSSWSNLTGIVFGPVDKTYKNYEDLITNLRTQYLSIELKKRFVYGAIATNYQNFNSCYLKAKKIVNILTNYFDQLFSNLDAILIPGASSTAAIVEDVINKKHHINIIDDLLQIANFSHYPSITIPYIKINNLPFGINLFSKRCNDEKLLQIAYYFEQNIIKFKDKYE